MTEPTDVTSEAPAARIEVVGGGVPTAAEVAALTVALTPVASADAPTGGATIRGAGDATPAWARAALLEGLGYRTPTRPSDLAAATQLG